MKRHPWLRGLLLPVAVLLLYFAFPLDADEAPVRVGIGIAASLVALVAVILLILAEVRRAERRLDALQLVLALESVVMIFAATYYLLASHDRNQFEGLETRLDALYFAMTTLTTVGYGDVRPVSQLARGVVTAQLAFNLLFVGAFIGLLQDRLASRRDGGASRRA